MPILARLKRGSLLLKKEIDERKPEITNGLINNIPFDGNAFDNVGGFEPLQNLNTNLNLIEASDLDWRDASNWTKFTQNGSLTWDEAEQALKATNGWWGTFNQWIKLDTSKNWYISATIKRTTSSGIFYLGNIAYNLAQTTTGITQKPGTHEYWGASGVAPTANQWVTYTNANIGGNPRTGENTTVGDQTTWFTGTNWIKFLFIANYNNATSITYIKDIKLWYTNTDSTNTPLTYDGVVVEPAKSNAVSNPSVFSSGWTPYNNGNDGSFVTEFGTEGLNLVNRRSWSGAYKGVTLPATGTYTLSVWIKVINRTNSAVQVNLYTSGGGISDTAVSASWSADKIGKWQRISMTRTYTTTSLTLFLIAYGGSDAAGWEVTAQYTMPQIEPGSRMNNFVDGSHSDITVGYKTGLSERGLNNLTIVFDYFYNGGVSNTVISNAQANSKWWGLYHNGSGQLYMHEGTNGNSHTSSYLQPTNTWATLAISWDNTTQKYYANGNLLGSLSTTGSTNSTNIPILYLGWGWNRGFGRFKNLRIYNRQLSDLEITKLSKSRNTILPDGTIRNDIIEKPLNIGEAFYFPLSINNKIIDTTVGGVSETGVVYEDRTAFCGSTVTTRLHFNLNSTIGLNWNSDYTIIYWKRPIGTHVGPSSLTGYNIESIGSNSNSVGGGYEWFGKNTGSNTLSNSIPSAINPSKYFNNWHMVALRKSGSSFTVTTYGDLGSGDSVSPFKSVRTLTTPTTANRYVTQYGYDLKLGGWDDINNCNTYFRDLIVIKRALTESEIETVYKKEMSFFSDYAQVQHEISEEAL